MKYILFFLLLIFGISCKVSYNPSLSLNSSQYSNYEMLIFVSVLASSEKEANLLCITKAFENILFIGTPNTINNIPMLDGPKSEYKSFFDSFIMKDKYAPFITSNIDLGSEIIKKSPKTIKYNKQITINVQSLRLFLTNEGVIRRFGY